MNLAQTPGAERLQSEILAAAKDQSDQILHRARDLAEQSMAAAQREAAEAAERKLAAARLEAKRRQESILSTVSVEVNRLRLAQAEQQLNLVRDGVVDQLRTLTPTQQRDALARLTAQALARLTGNQFLLRLSPSDFRLLGSGLAEEVQRLGERPWLKLEVGEDPHAADGDWVLQDEEGHQMWDLGLETRLERLWPELRRQIAAQSGLLAQGESGDV